MINTVPDIPMEYILETDPNMNKTKEYTLDNLHLGMKVLTSQIKGITNINIILANPVDVVMPDKTLETSGVIVYIGELNEQASRAYNKYKIYNKSGKYSKCPMLVYNKGEK